MREIVTVQKVELPRHILTASNGASSWSPIRLKYICLFRDKTFSLSKADFKAYRNNIRKNPNRPKIVFVSADPLIEEVKTKELVDIDEGCTTETKIVATPLSNEQLSNFEDI